MTFISDLKKFPAIYGTQSFIAISTTDPSKLVTMQPRGAKIPDSNIFTVVPNIVSFLGTELA